MRPLVDITPGAAVDVNASGWVTGERGSKAYVWEDGALRLLELAPGFAYSHGNRINDVGQEAGNVFTSGGLRIERLARWTPDGKVEILGGADDNNQSLGTNNHGTVVGYGAIGAGYDRGIIYVDGIGLRYLDDLVTTNEMKIFARRSINDAGQILATGLNTYTGEGMSVRLDPVSGPFMHEEDFSVRLMKDGTKASPSFGWSTRPAHQSGGRRSWLPGTRSVAGRARPGRPDEPGGQGKDRPRRQRGRRATAVPHHDQAPLVRVRPGRRRAATLRHGVGDHTGSVTGLIAELIRLLRPNLGTGSNEADGQLRSVLFPAGGQR